jgi:hypothetical protein
VTQTTGYRSRDDLLEENKRLKARLADTEQVGLERGQEIDHLQEQLAVANESLRVRSESYDQSEELRTRITLELIDAEKVSIGCPDNHPFKPEGTLQRGHVHQDGDQVTVWCSRGHFDRWYTG